MANNAKIKYARIERKYQKKIDKLMTEYQNKTMGELWVALDNLKEEMRKEWDGVSKSNQMDTEDDGSSKR